MKNLVKFTSLSLLAAALALAPAPLRAQDATTTTPAVTAPSDTSTNMPPAHKKKGASLPFHGKIAAIDATAGTFTVGTMSLTITSKTKITSTNNVPATLADFKVGDSVTGAYKKAADGTLNVSTLKMGMAKKKKAASTDAAPAPAPAAN